MHLKLPNNFYEQSKQRLIFGTIRPSGDSMNTQEQAAFDQAVRMIRDGSSTLAVDDTLESQFLGMDILMIRQIVAEAGGYLQNLQEKAFDASVEAFKRGESRIEVE